MDNSIESVDLPDRQGFSLKLSVLQDSSIEDPTDYNDGLTHKQIEAWNSGEWCYVTVTVTASLDGIDLGTASVGAIAYGLLYITTEKDVLLRREYVSAQDISEDADYMEDLILESIACAKRQLTDLFSLAMANWSPKD